MPAVTGPLLSIIGRPNALDREVSALSTSALLHRSAAALVDPARGVAAAHLQQFRTPLWVIMIALQIGVLAWFWNAGLSAALRDRLRRLMRPEFGVRFCFGALIAGLDKLAALAPQAVEYRYMRILELNNILFRSWLLEWIASTLLAMAVAGTIAAVVLWLADKTHQWYIYTICGVIGFTLLVTYANPYVFAPAFARLTPLHTSLTAISPVPVLEQHIGRRTQLGSAYVIGWGGSQRAVISDTMLRGATPAEIRFVLARAAAWVDENVALQITLVQGAFFVLGTALAVFISDRIGFRRDDDPVSRLALLGAVMGAVYLVALPFYNGYARAVDRIADQRAVAMTHDPAAAIRFVVRQADQALWPICPNTFAYWYFDAREPAGSRISDLQGRPDYCATRHP
jgi:Zn-dependent protease with chaperone function